MFDSNAMVELAHLSRDRYQRAGGGGANKVYNTGKAYWDARGWKDMSAWQRAVIEAREGFKWSAETAREHFRVDCWVDVDGTYLGDGVPF